MDEFFVIQVITPHGGTRGFLVDTPDGIKVSVGGITGDVTQFSTYEEATKYIRSRKIERHGIRAYAKSSTAIMQEKTNGLITIPPEKDMFFVENEIGEKLFYDSKTNGYYFKNGDVGFPCWENRSDIEASMKRQNFPFEIFIKVMPKSKPNEDI